LSGRPRVLCRVHRCKTWTTAAAGESINSDVRSQPDRFQNKTSLPTPVHSPLSRARLIIWIAPLILKQINNLHPPIPNKSGKIRNPDATQIFPRVHRPMPSARKTVEHDASFAAPRGACFAGAVRTRLARRTLCTDAICGWLVSGPPTFAPSR